MERISKQKQIMNDQKKALLEKYLENEIDISKFCHQTSVLNGFYEDERDEITTDRLLANIALMHSELSECVEAIRKKENIVESLREELMILDQIMKTDADHSVDGLLSPKLQNKLLPLKDGILWELTDTVIRINDTIGWIMKKAIKPEDVNEENNDDILHDGAFVMTHLIAIRNLMRERKHGKQA